MSTQPPNLNAISNDLQCISRNFSSLCLELTKLENLPSVDILTQLKNLHDVIGVKEQVKKIDDTVKTSDEKINKRLDELFANVKSVQANIDALSNRIAAVEKTQTAQKAAQTATDAHILSVKNNCYARNRNTASRNNYYGQELVVFRSNDNSLIPNFPKNTTEIDRANITIVDNILKALTLAVTGDERQRHDRLKSWIGRD